MLNTGPVILRRGLSAAQIETLTAICPTQPATREQSERNYTGYSKPYCGPTDMSSIS